MKILVIGHLSIDVFMENDGSMYERFGGIYYAIETLASLAAGNDRIIPVFGVEAPVHLGLMTALGKLENVDTRGIFTQEQPVSRVHHRMHEAGPETTCAQVVPPPIPFDAIEPFLGVDAILINMVSGSDIEVATLDHIRMSVRSARTPVLLDIHNLTLGSNEQHERYRRPLIEWRRWAFMIDVIQMNETEMNGLTVEKMSEKETVGHLFTLGVKAVLVTRGSRGVTLFQTDHKKIMQIDIECPPPIVSASMVGNGDAFGAALVFGYLSSRDMVAAARFGVEKVSDRLRTRLEHKSNKEPARIHIANSP